VYDDGPSKYFLFIFPIFTIVYFNFLGPDAYQQIKPINIKQPESTTRNVPSFSVQKSYLNNKVVISSKHTVDNMGSSSPGVGHYNNDTKKLYKAVKRNTNFSCSFGKAHRLSTNENGGLGSSGSLKELVNMDLA
tara:strand:- start:438 stop:839 length:402 start_codon:yes stop_codon:yes gene_type:complete